MYDAPSGYGGAMGGQRDRITQALMNIQNPPPVTQMPQQPGSPQMGMPLGGQPAPFAGSGMTGAPPGAPTAAQPMGGAPAPMMPGGAMPQPMSPTPQQTPMPQQTPY